jgi:GAF domain-containing protein
VNTEVVRRGSHRLAAVLAHHVERIAVRSAARTQKTKIRELDRVVHEHAAFRRIATILARESSAEEVFAKVAEQVARLVGAEFAAIEHYEPDGHATVAGLWGDIDDVVRLGQRIRLDGESVTAAVYREQRPVRFDDYEKAGDSIATLARKAGMRSAIGAPIFVNRRLWGAIVAATSRAEPIPDGAESQIAAFTELVAAAISNVQAQEKLERLAEEQAALRRVATMVANGCSPEEAFVKVAEEVGLLLGVDSAAIQRYEPAGDATVVGNWGKLGEAFRIGSRLTLDGDSVIAQVYRTRRPVRVDRYDDASGSAVERAREVGLRSGAGSPIVVDGRLWGVMGIATSAAQPLPVDAESRIAEFTELVATAMSNAQARSDLERLAEEQAALRRVAMMVARESSPEEIFAQVAEEVGLLLGGERAVIQRYDP